MMTTSRDWSVKPRKWSQATFRRENEYERRERKGAELKGTAVTKSLWEMGSLWGSKGHSDEGRHEGEERSSFEYTDRYE